MRYPFFEESVRAKREAYHQTHRTEPDYWVRKAESALQFGMLEKVAGYLALARYYRDGEAESVQVARQAGV